MNGLPLDIRQFTVDDLRLMNALLPMFGAAFNDVPGYTKNRPSEAYLRRLLGGESFIALVALKGDEVVGGIAAYELKKFEQELSEIYIYDLAVASTHRRQGVATALIQELKKVAVGRGAFVIFVQADAPVATRPGFPRWRSALVNLYHRTLNHPVG